MNQTRSFLLIAWLVVAALLWMEWNKGEQAATAGPAVLDSSLQAPGAAAPLPATGAAAGAPAPLPGTVAAASTSSTVAGSGRPIVIANDRLRLTIDLEGGRVVDSRLLQYTVEKKAGSPFVRVINDAPATYHVADAGLIIVDDKNTQRELVTQFQTASGGNRFEIAHGAPAVIVPLQWTDPATGLSIQRTLTLKRGSYVLEVDDKVGNAGPGARLVYPFVRLSRVAPPAPPKHSFMTSPDTFSFVGAAWYTPEEKYVKAALGDFLDEAPPSADTAGGWIGMLQHHFASAWVPMPEEKQRLQTTVSSHDGRPLFQIRSIAAPLDVAAGASASHRSRLWVGPKLQKPMSELADTLPLSVDYGVLAFIGKPLFWVLSKLHLLFANWGWAIIAIVVLLKLLLYPLSAKQYQSMAKMRAVQPRIEALKERYGDDKQQFQIAMMELYKKEKINPIGGCLPMLIPIPIFLGLYWVLLETVELRHAPWVGWIQNLTAADPYFILPALNLIVMYLTQKLTPMPGMDPLQKKMMQFMPLVFGVMMAFFPAGLVLYWVTNGLLGLAQQWWMTKRHGPKTLVVAR